MGEGSADRQPDPALVCQVRAQHRREEHDAGPAALLHRESRASASLTQVDTNLQNICSCTTPQTMFLSENEAGFDFAK